MAKMKILTLLYFFTIIISLPIYSHENYVLYEVTAFNPHEREVLYFLHLKKPSIIFVNGVSNEAAIPIDVIVRNDNAQMFETKLLSHGIQYSFISFISDTQLLNKRKILSNNVWESFCNWENISSWINSLQKKHNAIIKKTVIAKSYERRDIFFLKISKGKRKPIIFIVGGEDGMDWMSSALILNLISELLESTDFNKLLNIFDFYLLPILNPDGFVYSKNKDRLWRKNRKEIFPKKKCNDVDFAVGVDIGRNWFFQKSLKLVDEECNSIYIGHKALSVEETQSLSYVLNSLAQGILAFIDVRGFGRYMTVPYGHTKAHSNNYDIVVEILKSISSKVQEKHNVTYYVAATSSIFYNFTGNMADWVKFKLNIPVVYTIYLEESTTVIPLPQHIQLLKKQFFLILNESLPLFYDIYWPIYKNHNIPLSFNAHKKYLLFNAIVIYFHKTHYNILYTWSLIYSDF